MKDYLDLFSASHQRVAGRRIEGRKFLDAFYECFIGKSEEIAAKFKYTNMAHQREHLELSLNHMIYFSIDRRASDELSRVARVHALGGLDVRPELYEIWMQSLIEVVARFDPHFDPEIELAWRVLLAPGIAYMKGHYELGDERNSAADAKTKVDDRGE